MIDWDEILNTEDLDELKQAKLWLFQENIRLENERDEFIRSRDKFLEERVQLRDEMVTLNRRIVTEQKRLKDENLFFEKKMAILTDGFRQLEEDRRNFEKEKRQFYVEKTSCEPATNLSAGEIVSALFRNTNNPLALRKRYRDLVKIFHPDNLFGDEELAQQINNEYMRRRKEE